MNEDLIIEDQKKINLVGKKASRRIIGAVRSFLNYEKSVILTGVIICLIIRLWYL